MFARLPARAASPRPHSHPEMDPARLPGRAEQRDGTAVSISHEAEGEVGPAGTTVMMLHCLFAMVFAAGTLGLLNCLGFVVRSGGGCCPADDGGGYSPCEVWRDLRSVLSFVLGALLCCVLTHERRPADGCGKVQLYTCLL
mmetsp:Transcript_119483/g.372263  ORF Transcript_119483/g.372263 Transcript_119483/m.372263 type:complete len:141 (+) Transcript_119483:92-514(+)